MKRVKLITRFLFVPAILSVSAYLTTGNSLALIFVFVLTILFEFEDWRIEILEQKVEFLKAQTVVHHTHVYQSVPPGEIEKVVDRHLRNTRVHADKERR